MSSDELNNLVIQLQDDLMETVRQKEERQIQIERLQYKLEATENTVLHLSRKMKSCQSPSNSVYSQSPLNRRSRSEASLNRETGSWDQLYHRMVVDNGGDGSGVGCWDKHPAAANLNNAMPFENYCAKSQDYISSLQRVRGLSSSLTLKTQKKQRHPGTSHIPIMKQHSGRTGDLTHNGREVSCNVYDHPVDDGDKAMSTNNCNEPYIAMTTTGFTTSIPANVTPPPSPPPPLPPGNYPIQQHPISPLLINSQVSNSSSFNNRGHEVVDGSITIVSSPNQQGHPHSIGSPGFDHTAPPLQAVNSQQQHMMTSPQQYDCSSSQVDSRQQHYISHIIPTPYRPHAIYQSLQPVKNRQNKSPPRSPHRQTTSPQTNPHIQKIISPQTSLDIQSKSLQSGHRRPQSPQQNLQNQHYSEMNPEQQTIPSQQKPRQQHNSLHVTSDGLIDSHYIIRHPQTTTATSTENQQLIQPQDNNTHKPIPKNHTTTPQPILSTRQQYYYDYDDSRVNEKLVALRPLHPPYQIFDQTKEHCDENKKISSTQQQQQQQPQTSNSDQLNHYQPGYQCQPTMQLSVPQPGYTTQHQHHVTNQPIPQQTRYPTLTFQQPSNHYLIGSQSHGQQETHIIQNNYTNYENNKTPLPCCNDNNNISNKNDIDSFKTIKEDGDGEKMKNHGHSQVANDASKQSATSVNFLSNDNDGNDHRIAENNDSNRPEASIIKQLQELLIEKEKVWRTETSEIKQRMKKENVLLMQENELLQEEIKLLKDSVKGHEDTIINLRHENEADRNYMKEETKSYEKDKSDMENELIKQDKDIVVLDKTLYELELKKKESDIQRKKLSDESEETKAKLTKVKTEVESLKEVNRNLKEKLLIKEAALQEKIFTVNKLTAEKIDHRISMCHGGGSGSRVIRSQNDLDAVKGDDAELLKTSKSLYVKHCQLKVDFDNLQTLCDQKDKHEKELLKDNSTLAEEMSKMKEEIQKLRLEKDRADVNFGFQIEDMERQLEEKDDMKNRLVQAEFELESKKGLDEEFGRLRGRLESKVKIEMKLRSRLSEMVTVMTREKSLRENVERELSEKMEKIKKRDKQCQMLCEKFGKLDTAFIRQTELLKEKTEALNFLSKRQQFQGVAFTHNHAGGKHNEENSYGSKL